MGLKLRHEGPWSGRCGGHNFKFSTMVVAMYNIACLLRGIFILFYKFDTLIVEGGVFKS